MFRGGEVRQEIAKGCGAVLDERRKVTKHIREVFMPGSRVNIGNAGSAKKKSKNSSVMKKSKGGACNENV
jgi:hypothetical protein